MKRFGVAVVFLTASSVLVGCPLLKKKSDAGSEDDDPLGLAALADAATVSAVGVGAKNEASVLRYANETPLANLPGVIGDNGATARNFPGNGPTVAFLPKGTVVSKIAQYFNSGVLVMFDDSIGDGSKLIGWVPIKAFDLAAPPPTKTVTPPVPTVVKKVDAGGPTPTVDAGGGGNVAVVDAGGGGGNNSTIPTPPKGVVAVPPVNGKCPDGFGLAESMCRRKCATEADCGRGIKCVAKGGLKVCSSG